jgi:prepilin-type N-terminal cleavage/methylation domain-containing protein/prepilin-type processing-associated H-X9-DG protein
MQRRAFTLIELIVVIAIVALLVGLLLPALGAARRAGWSARCLSNQRQLALGLGLYADAYKDVLVPHRAPNLPGGTGNPANWYEIGNGRKFRPTWIAWIGQYVGIYAFAEPRTDADRQDFESPVYVCPVVRERTDERNAAYGYNYQFLGNSRITNGRYHNFPVARWRVRTPDRTFVAGDSLGTAAAFPPSARLPYHNDGREEAAVGNEAFSIDPPRMTPRSDMASHPHRNGVDPRHDGKVIGMFADGHARGVGFLDLGYRFAPDGSHESFGGGSDPPTNALFSGTGSDDDPPPLPD